MKTLFGVIGIVVILVLVGRMLYIRHKIRKQFKAKLVQELGNDKLEPWQKKVIDEFAAKVVDQEPESAVKFIKRVK